MAILQLQIAVMDLVVTVAALSASTYVLLMISIAAASYSNDMPK